MSIQVKFFASLREKIGTADAECAGGDGLTVQELWKKVAGDQEFTANVLVAVNMEYVERNHVVQDGDEVAFFPPVTGG